MSSSTKVTLRHHTPKAGRVGPVVVSFPHGPPPPESFSNKDDDELSSGVGPLAFHMLASKSSRDSKRMVVASNGKAMYQGRNFGETSTSQSLSKYMVGVYDKETKQVDLYDVDHIYALQQQAMRAPRPATSTTGIDGDITDKDRRKLLIETFGSRKKQNLQRSREANIVKAQNVSASSAVSRMLNKKAAKAASAVEPAEADALATRRAFLPPCNFDAKTVEEAYPLEGLVTREEQMALTPGVKEMLPKVKKSSEIATMRENHTFGEYVLQHFETMPRDKKAARAHMRLLMYISHLQQMVEAPRIMKTAKPDTTFGTEDDALVPSLAGIPPGVVTRMLSLFAERQVSPGGRLSYVRTQFLRDKLLVHLCAVCLTLENYDMDITVLSKDLRMAPKSLLAFFRELGCTYKGGSRKRKRGDDEEETGAGAGSGAGAGAGAGAAESAAGPGYRVRLKVPLVFPKVKKGGRR